eukprot:3686892-Alexandrium_andersonii.AAC.1
MFGVNILETLFPDMYLIESVVVCCSALGRACAGSASVIVRVVKAPLPSAAKLLSVADVSRGCGTASPSS